MVLDKSKIKRILDKYPFPCVYINNNKDVGYANHLAKELFGEEYENEKCYNYIRGNKEACGGFCVKQNFSVEARKVKTGSVILRPGTNPKGFERIVTAISMLNNDLPDGHIEYFEKLPLLRSVVRSSQEFSDTLNEIDNEDDILEALVDYLSSNRRGLKFRVRVYKYSSGRNIHRSVLRIFSFDNRQDGIPYSANIQSRAISKDDPNGYISFACFDENKWTILTNQDFHVDIFKLHFGAIQDESNKKIFRSRDNFFSDLILYKYNNDEYTNPVFLDRVYQTWIDIPIIYNEEPEYKISVSFIHKDQNFYRERLEALKIIINIVEHRLTAVKAIKLYAREVESNVVHEVAQPAFSALASIQFLREDDPKSNKMTADELYKYYLKKNIETSIKLVAFLNDRSRIHERTLSWGEKRINLLSDVIAGVVNLVRFRIYESYLKNSAMKLNAENVQDLTLDIDGEAEDNQEICFSASDCKYSIHYSQECDRVYLYILKYRLQQVFFNLLDNSLKYKMPNEDYIAQIIYRKFPMSPSIYKGYHVIDVLDWGVGIEDNERVKIFDLFQRSRYAIEESKRTGSGRGLYVCREVLRGLGGDIYVFQLKKPTIFRILLPKECGIIAWDDKIDYLRERTRLILLDPASGA